MNTRLKTAEGRTIYTCDRCAKTEPWGDEWVWYGSYKDLDDGVKVPHYCSQACAEGNAKRKHSAALRVAKNAGLL